MNKRQRNPKGQCRIDNQETHWTTLDTRHRMKENKAKYNTQP